MTIEVIFKADSGVRFRHVANIRQEGDNFILSGKKRGEIAIPISNVAQIAIVTEDVGEVRPDEQF